MMLPAVMLGQAGTQASQPDWPINQPFASIDESLVRRADAALAPSAQRLVPNTLTRQESETARTGDASAASPQTSLNLVPTAAQERVNQLRPIVAPILRADGLPPELAAVILVESGGNPAALSPKGARGLWQLMPETARRYGLEVDGERDERLDIEKSTRAAAHYLGDLHLQFGSWPLALAAYNTGEQNLQRAIDRSHSTQFAVLSSLGWIPQETRSYVPAVMAAMGNRGLTTLFAQRDTAQKPAMVFAATTP
jgi:soluble lytic murein transglycosylase-like protein